MSYGLAPEIWAGRESLANIDGNLKTDDTAKYGGFFASKTKPRYDTSSYLDAYAFITTDTLLDF